MIEIQINHQTYEVPEGISIIEAADRNGVYIPRFCYHKKLSIAANCRMCLVEVENVKKPVAACATPVSPDMKVFTQSEAALDAQRTVMEFLLINHPLDCPVCDQGGACELQDLSMGFGCSESDFGGSKRSVPELELGPLVQTYLTRCIQCTRCVRFSRELAGLSELGLIDRGEGERISTYVKRDLQSELSGNMIDVCPVGALTAKPSRFVGRSWEYIEHPGVSAHDALGSNVFWHSMRHDNVDTREVMRVVPKENEAINQCWLSDRDRFSFEGLSHESRALKPMVKRNGSWEDVSWEFALSETADKLQHLFNQHGGDCLGALVGSQTTNEEGYLLQKLLRGFGVQAIDSRLREQDFTDQANRSVPTLGASLEEFAKSDMVFFVGCDVRSQHPVLTVRLNEAVLDNELSICSMSVADYQFTFPLASNVLVSPTEMVNQLAALVTRVASEKGAKASVGKSLPLDDATKQLAERLSASNSCKIVMGEQAMASPYASTIRSLLAQLADLLSGSFGELPNGANTVGLQQVGCLPHRSVGSHPLADSGQDAVSMVEQPKRAYVLFQVEPEFDVARAAQTLKALDQAALVICFTPFVSEAMRSYTDVILPIAPPSETAGSYTNILGEEQSFQAVSVPHGDARPGWKVLRVFAHFMKVNEFEYPSLDAVRSELKAAMESAKPATESLTHLDCLPASLAISLMRVAPWPMVRSDALVRRAESLQNTLRKEQSVARLNPKTAESHGVSEGDRIRITQDGDQAEMDCIIDPTVSDECVIIPSGLTALAGFGSAEQALTLEKINA